MKKFFQDNCMMAEMCMCPRMRTLFSASRSYVLSV